MTAVSTANLIPQCLEINKSYTPSSAALATTPSSTLIPSLSFPFWWDAIREVTRAVALRPVFSARVLGIICNASANLLIEY